MGASRVLCKWELEDGQRSVVIEPKGALVIECYELLLDAAMSGARGGGYRQVVGGRRHRRWTVGARARRVVDDVAGIFPVLPERAAHVACPARTRRFFYYAPP